MQPYRFDTRQAASYPGKRSLRIKAAQVVYHSPFSLNKTIYTGLIAPPPTLQKSPPMTSRGLTALAEATDIRYPATNFKNKLN